MVAADGISGFTIEPGTFTVAHVLTVTTMQLPLDQPLPMGAVSAGPVLTLALPAADMPQRSIGVTVAITPNIALQASRRLLNMQPAGVTATYWYNYNLHVWVPLANSTIMTPAETRMPGFSAQFTNIWTADKPAITPWDFDMVGLTIGLSVSLMILASIALYTLYHAVH